MSKKSKKSKGTKSSKAKKPPRSEEETGNGELPPLDAMTLRRLGETADGGRRRDQVLAIDHEGEGAPQYDVIDRNVLAANPSRYTFVTDIEVPSTMKVSRDLVAFDQVVFKKGKREIACAGPPTDCLFWTDSAMEKFVFPYYEQVRIFPAEYLEQLKADFRDPEKRKKIVAVQHRDPSKSQTLVVGSCKVPNETPGVSYLTLKPDPKEGDGEYEWLSPEDFRARF